MGMRKRNNQRIAQERIKAKARREKKRIKRAKKAETAGQKLHEKMHGRS